MRKKFVQIAAFLLILVLLPALSASAAPARGSETLIRVGLYYGSDAMPGANLENYAGSGYQFGYMDGDTFVPVGFTTETAISMVKTQNVWYSSSLPTGGYGYSDQVSSNIAVGCYHLRLADSYATFEDALDAARAVGGYPAWIRGEYQVRIGAYESKAAAEAAMGGLGNVSVVGTSSRGISVVITGTDQPVFQFDGGDSCPALVVSPGLDDSVEAVTYFKGYKYHGDFRYERVDGGDLTVVSLVSMEDYIRGIIPYEMINTWPLEALKAQAVCARSYTMTNLGKHSSSHFDICNTTHCQVYYGVNQANDLTDRAVAETAGQYLWYHGEIIEAVYHASDGGATENCENVWNEAVPYLRGVEDPFEALVEDEISNYHWTMTYTGRELQARLNAQNYACGEIVDVRVSETTEMGSVYSVRFTDVNGKTFELTKYAARTALGCRSLRYTISGGSGDDGNDYALANGGSLDSLSGAWALDGDGDLVQVAGPAYAVTGSGVEAVSSASKNPDGTFVISGTGNGHNLGMSQWGAYAMALEGYTYEDILAFYFTGIEIG